MHLEIEGIGEHINFYFLLNLSMLVLLYILYSGDAIPVIVQKPPLKKCIRAGSDLLLNISLSGGQSFKVDQITSAKRE